MMGDEWVDVFRECFEGLDYELSRRCLPSPTGATAR